MTDDARSTTSVTAKTDLLPADVAPVALIRGTSLSTTPDSKLLLSTTSGNTSAGDSPQVYSVVQPRYLQPLHTTSGGLGPLDNPAIHQLPVRPAILEKESSNPDVADVSSKVQSANAEQCTATDLLASPRGLDRMERIAESGECGKGAPSGPPVGASSVTFSSNISEEPQTLRLRVRSGSTDATESSSAGTSTDSNRKRGGSKGGRGSSAKGVRYKDTATQATKSSRTKGIQTEDLSHSLWVFSMESGVRRVCQWIMDFVWFDRFVILCILISTVMMAITDPDPAKRNSDWNQRLAMIEFAITIFFTVEMVIKIIAMGFILEYGSYLRDSWNVLDFVCVLSALAALGPGSSYSFLKVTRLLRVFRPLRVIQRFPALMLLANTVLASIPHLVNVLVLISITSIIFGVIGVQLFKGALHGRCFDTDPDTGALLWLSDNERLCHRDGFPGTGYECDKSAGQVCGYHDSNPNYGVISYDNILVASLAVFQSMTLEGWSDQTYMLMDTVGPASCIYGILIVFIGAFLVMNLSLAVIYDSYTEMKAKVMNKGDGRRKKQSGLGDEEEEDYEFDNYYTEEAALRDRINNIDYDHYAQFGSDDSTEEEGSDADAETPSPDVESSRPTAVAPAPVQPLLPAAADGAKAGPSALQPVRGSVPLGTGQAVTEAVEAGPASAEPPSLKERVHDLVVSTAFEIAITVIVMLNILVTCLYYHDCPDAILQLVGWTNQVSTAIFTIEMVLKIWGLGLKTYFSDEFNQFDFIIVIQSLVMIILDAIGTESMSGVSALRALRVLRVFKLAKSWKELQAFLVSMVVAVKSIVPFLLLMIVVLLVFALLGIDLFATRLPGNRFNFDNLYWACITTFGIMLGENWNEELQFAVGQRGWSAAAYYMALFLIGNTLFMNLFVTILIDAFESVREQAEQQKAKEEKACKDAADAALQENQELPTAGNADGEESSSSDQPRTPVLATTLSAKLSGSKLELEKEHEASAKRAEEERERQPTTFTEKVALDLQRIKAGLLSQTQVTKHTLNKQASTVGLGLAVAKSLSPTATPSPSGAVPRPVSAMATVDEEKEPANGKDSEAKGAVRDTSEASKCGQELEDIAERAIAGSMSGMSAFGTASGAPLAVVLPPVPTHGQAVVESASQDKLAGREDSERQLRGHSIMDMSTLVADEEPPPADEPASEPQGKSCGLFEPRCWARRWAMRMVSHPLFEAGVMTLILLSTIQLAIDSPRVEAGSGLADALTTANMVFSTLFTIEMLVKMFVLGVARNEGAYLRSGWNCLDFFVVGVSWISLGLPEFNFLRVLRAARPLRLVARQPELRRVVSSLGTAIAQSLNVVVVGLLLVLVFSSMGVSLFSGTFYRCSDPSINRRAECVGIVGNSTGTGLDTDTDLAGQERRWYRTSKYHFDNIFAAALTIFEISNMEMWPSILISGLDSVDDESAMQENARLWTVVYFVVVIVLFALFYLNVCVGIVITTYTHLKQGDGTDELTDELKEWHFTFCSMQKCSPAKGPPLPSFKPFRYIYRMVNSKLFERAVTLTIMANFLFMMLERWDASQQGLTILENANTTFTLLFLAELILKVAGLGILEYLYDTQNVFDFVIVTMTMVELLSPAVSGIGWIRTIRLFRIYRLMRHLPGIGTLFQAVAMGLPQMCHVASVLFIFLYIYAVAGMNLFGDAPYYEFIHPNANFGSFGVAMLTLLRCATGESYNAIMHELATDPVCSLAKGAASPHQSVPGCGSMLAMPFFVSFEVLVQLLLLNLVVAVVLDSYSKCLADQKRLINSVHIEYFRACWLALDPNGCGFVPADTFFDFLTTMEEPFGVMRSQQEFRKIQMVPMYSELSLPLYEVPRAKLAIKDRLRPPLDPFRKPKEPKQDPDPNSRFPRRTMHEDDAAICVSFHDVIQALAAQELCRQPGMDHTDSKVVMRSMQEERKRRLQRFQQEAGTFGSVRKASTAGTLMHYWNGGSNYDLSPSYNFREDPREYEVHKLKLMAYASITKGYNKVAPAPAEGRPAGDTSGNGAAAPPEAGAVQVNGAEPPGGDPQGVDRGGGGEGGGAAGPPRAEDGSTGMRVLDAEDVRSLWRFGSRKKQKDAWNAVLRDVEGMPLPVGTLRPALMAYKLHHYTAVQAIESMAKIKQARNLCIQVFENEADRVDRQLGRSPSTRKKNRKRAGSSVAYFAKSVNQLDKPRWVVDQSNM